MTDYHFGRTEETPANQPGSPSSNRIIGYCKEHGTPLRYHTCLLRYVYNEETETVVKDHKHLAAVPTPEQKPLTDAIVSALEQVNDKLTNAIAATKGLSPMAEYKHPVTRTVRTKAGWVGQILLSANDGGANDASPIVWESKPFNDKKNKKGYVLEHGNALAHNAAQERITRVLTKLFE